MLRKEAGGQKIEGLCELVMTGGCIDSKLKPNTLLPKRSSTFLLFLSFEMSAYSILHDIMRTDQLESARERLKGLGDPGALALRAALLGKLPSVVPSLGEASYKIIHAIMDIDQLEDAITRLKACDDPLAPALRAALQGKPAPSAEEVAPNPELAPAPEPVLEPEVAHFYWKCWDGFDAISSDSLTAEKWGVITMPVETPAEEVKECCRMNGRPGYVQVSSGAGQYYLLPRSWTYKTIRARRRDRIGQGVKGCKYTTHVLRKH